MSTPKLVASRLRSLLFLGGIVALSMPVLSAVGCMPESQSDEPAERTASPDEEALASVERYPHKAFCDKAAAPGSARCHARVRTLEDGQTIQSFATPQGFVPSQLVSAYQIPAVGTGTIALVDAQDDPNAESDLAVYRAQFGLPPCTTANGCFKKVNQNGAASPLPSPDSGWAGEISLDLDMVSAACPSCKIILVEANSATNDDLGAAVNAAAALGANAISNSYGGSEDSSVTTDDTEYYDHPGIIITASAGDSGYGTEYPASGAHVIGVGGTTLAQSSSPRGWAEGAWADGGSGCSSYVTKPSFQKDTGCAKRTVADVSAVADPNTGVAVYDTYGGSAAGATGWIVVGGTSAASPLVASILVAAGKSGIDNSWPYANVADFYDVTTGSNGTCSSSAKYLCTAGPGYDGPTGLGTPNGKAIASGSSGSSSSSSSTSSTSTSSSSTSASSSSGKSSSSSSSGGTTSSSSSSSSSSTSSSGGTCSHPICSQGSSLTSSCNACATKICASDPYCCNTLWDNVCVGEVGSICGESCGGGGGSGSSSSSSSSTSTSSSGGTCSHGICNSGIKLKPGCDPCAADVCSYDPYCCATLWDNICVSEVGSVCGETCN
jgi:hypothetical protein